MAKHLAALVRGRASLVPVQREVQRGGGTFVQTFYVRTDDARVLSELHQARQPDQPVGMREQGSGNWVTRQYSFGPHQKAEVVGQWDLSPGNPHLGGDSAVRVLANEGWTKGRDTLIKKLGLDRLNVPAGHEVVYRLSHRGGGGLASRNAGNLEGVIAYADDQAEKGIGHGEFLTAYAVRLPKTFKSYVELEGGRRRG